MQTPSFLSKDQDEKLWYTETLHKGLATSYEVTSVVFDSNTPHQRLIVADTARFGRVMALDGATQVTTCDEYVYHEMLSHVPLLAHGAAKSVLIIGGGDGGMAEEVLKHRSVQRLVMVEIDPGVIEFARSHFFELHQGCFDDPRFELVIADGKVFAQTSSETFDVIIIDSTDPVGPGEVLFTRSFYTDCRRLLNPGGILVTQNGVPFFQPDELQNTVYNFSRIFKDASCYLAVVPTYVGGYMALGWGTDAAELRAIPLSVLEERFQQAQLMDLRYYSPKVHQAAFVLPVFIETIVQKGLVGAGS